MPRRPAANPRRPRAPRRRRGIAKKPLVKLMKAVATKTLNAGLETKYVCDTFNNIQFNSAITSGTECYSCYPKLGPGPGTFQRIGLDVTPMRVKNTWVVSLNSVNRSENLYVDMFIMIDKNNRFYPQIAGGSPPAFLRSGNSSGFPGGNGNTQLYNGVNTDAFRMINKERYTLLKHFRFQLAANVGLANNDTTAGNSPNVAGQSVRTLSYIVDTPKQLRYEPTATGGGPAVASYPNGHAPFWVLGYSKVDGSAPDVVNQSVTVSHITEMIYKDA